ncbi:uncharacterized protein [Rutidosis leptorrhynchoides]|uniref:uncharacterized protein n=1 Tax=Rutidosis leptorrhynchoides TaxID=125765 RepID=UPI003A99229C
MGFGDRWRKWIRSCLTTASVSILVNGSSTREFSLERGIRQGNPLSPFLFILAAEGLNILAKSALNKGLFNGIEVGNDKVMVSHLQYADDTIFFGECSRSNARNLQKLLKCFELASGKFFWDGSDTGLKISWVKWDTILNSYGLDGLNIGSLKGKNLALLAKWWWRFKTETNSLWGKVIRSIYGSSGGLESGGDLGYRPALGTWYNIILAGNCIEDLEIKFKNSLSKTIGNGSDTSFWNDVWVGNAKLSVLFPRLYRLEAEANVTVAARFQGGSSTRLGLVNQWAVG